MDGVFVPNISFGIPVIASLRKVTDIPFDVHLMITEPERYVTEFVNAGADIITVHYEACSDIAVTLDAIRLNGKKVGLSIKPNTPASAIFPYLDKCDWLLIMTVEPGFGGQSLIESTLPKIKEIKDEAKRQGINIKVEADGGIGAKNIALLRDAGADIVVAGSAVFGAPDRRAAIEALKNV